MSEKSNSKKDGLYAVVNGVEYQISNIFSTSFGAGENVFQGLVGTDLMRVAKDIDGTFYLEYGGYPSPDLVERDLWKEVLAYSITPTEDRIRFCDDSDWCVFKPGTIAEIERLANKGNNAQLPLCQMTVLVLFRTADMAIIGVRRVDPHLTAIDGVSGKEL